MIINSIDEMKQFLPSLMMKTSGSMLLHEAIYNADTWLRQHITGEDIYARVDGAETGGDSSLRRLMSQAVSLTAFLSVLADLDVALTDAGFVVVQDTSMTPASRARVDKLEASLKQRRLNCLSDIISLLHSDESWQDTAQAKHLCRSFVATKDELLSYAPGLGIPDYEALTAYQDKVFTALYHDLSSWIPAATVTELNTLYRTGALTQVGHVAAEAIVRSAVTFATGADGASRALAAYSFLKRNPDAFPYFVDPLQQVSQNNESPVVNML